MMRCKCGAKIYCEDGGRLLKDSKKDKMVINMRQFDELCEKGVIKLNDEIIDIVVGWIEDAGFEVKRDTDMA